MVSGLPGELKKTGKLTGAIDTSWAEGVGSGGGESSAEIATGMGEGEPTGPTEPPERIDPTDAS
ncbi:MAG: hypothetical protein MUF34_17575 [Polyangiaceae bacterium]|nr:hypothetical protein [Polyangiaceae bacterium]